VIVVVVLGILATIGMPMYNNTIEKAKAKACEINLKALLGAIETRTIEQNSFPASLSKLTNAELERAWVKVLKDEGRLKVKITFFLADFDEYGLAYAQENWLHRYIGDASVLKCPANHQGGVSYGLNGNLVGMTHRAYKALSPDTLVVADSNKTVFSGEEDLTKRHKVYKFFSSKAYAQAMDRGERRITTGIGHFFSSGKYSIRLNSDNIIK
jgi:competence protein ComGC